MSRSRLKTPQGQQKKAPMEDTKAKPSEEGTPSSIRLSDPAEFLYDRFVEAHDGRDAHGRMKKWHELSVYDRRAWRAVNEHMISASGHINVRMPEVGRLCILHRNEHVFAVADVPIEGMQKIADVRKVLKSLAEELDRLQKEYEKQAQKAKVVRINEPKKFGAPR